MVISLVQLNIVWEDKKRNFDRAKEAVRTEAKKGCDLVLFSEMSFTGFSMHTDLIAESNNEILKEVQKLAKANRVSLGFGWAERTNPGCFNKYTVVNKNGEVLSSYSKIHPFSYAQEDKYFKSGEEIVGFDLCGIPFSIFVCYDLRFPELFRIVANRVHAIIIPANWPASRSEHWKTLLKARAIENQLYIFAINCVGEMDGQYYSGDSCVINPNGDVVEVLSEKEGIITYNFKDDTEKFRAEFPVLKDRKLEVYDKFFLRK